MGLADIIAQFIAEGLERSEGSLELSRGALADRFGCVPSQINYVLTTRFTPEHGYAVETRRGGGGYIRITRVRVPRETLLMHTVNAARDTLDTHSAAALLQNLAHVLPVEPLRLIGAACSDKALRGVPFPQRDAVRAQIFKQCLLQLSLD